MQSRPVYSGLGMAVSSRMCFVSLGAGIKARKAPSNYVMSVCLRLYQFNSHWIYIYVKFGIGDFYENMSRKSKCDYWTKTPETLCGELITLYNVDSNIRKSTTMQTINNFCIPRQHFLHCTLLAATTKRTLLFAFP